MAEVSLITLTPALSLRERGSVGWHSCLALHFSCPCQPSRERGSVGWHSCLALHFYLPLSALKGEGDVGGGPESKCDCPARSHPTIGWAIIHRLVAV